MTQKNKQAHVTEADMVATLYQNMFDPKFLGTQESRDTVLDICMKAVQPTASEAFAKTVESIVTLKCTIDDQQGNPSTAERLSNVMKTLRGGVEQSI